MFALWSNIRVSVRSELPGWVAGGVHPSIMAPQGSSPIKSGNSLCSTAAQVGGGVEGWEAEGQVWARTGAHRDIMASHGSIPVIAGSLVGSTAA